MKKLLLAALFAGAVSAPACAAELVSNGGFESPYGLNEGWSYTVSNTLYVLGGATAHSGDYGLLFSAGADYVADYIYQTLDTVVGETYHYSYWLGAAQTSGEESNFNALLGSETIGNYGYGGSYAHQHIFGDFVATSDQTEIRFEAYNTTGVFALDDVSVTGPLAGEIDIPGTGGGVPEPATWAMMLLGFGGIGVALRRRRPSLLLAA